MSNDLVSYNGPAGGGDTFGSGDSGHSTGGQSSREVEIRRIMATDMARYRREGLDQELAMIVSEREQTSDAVVQLPPHVSKSLLQSTEEGRELIRAWQTAPGGFEQQIRQAQASALEIVRGVGEIRSQRAFMERFDRDLSERCRYLIYNELRSGHAGNPPPASPDDVRRFADTPAGRELVAEWGPRASQMVARVWARFDRLGRSMRQTDEAADFVHWYSQLSPAAIKAICRHLTA